ncbi:hypothetical protein D8B26_004818 [Coccidioides posadasii str. Silveira]|uniref:Uncharacterized protein n=2 Tax=Coccidioides posadasii TaxID=199306 RepID=E9D6H3_COCPS|nr:hypothetical protein CPC735_063420 [Coccidioides posadasii C735 delta SOWgp]EER28469.1 hypothetical protein CPC735_063420 [Coccidioides posadasii C735 delta SOWgp]EFW17845.1 conserved hypothetical protein [Coccidioides posadasii str. Silveira]QVM10156.1 hypothetical protein D8B26_004818 [Coccidioides posadasii str. Silveira]|eukprot:XP_003070614.1 hypothetical protein CPC735_063420 [Coccidioides posadasii C735 delta SOWgp]
MSCGTQEEQIILDTQDAQDAPLQSLFPPEQDDPDDLDYENYDDEVNVFVEEREVHSKPQDWLGNSDEETSLSSEGDSLERPNRFEGSRRSWLSWTKSERQEVTALETIRARDLSLHLYNAFALKRRAKKVRVERSQNNKEEDRIDNANEIYREDLLSIFAPSRTWTAWPLPTEIVPRTVEKVIRDEDEDWTLRGEIDSRPSAELEDCLMAQMMKFAKERFEYREWSQKSACYRGKDTNPGSDSEAMPSEKDDERGHPTSIAGTLRPVVQADDEESKRIMRPEARHIISKLDDLFLNLYHARRAYLTATDMAQSGDETGDENTKGTPTPLYEGRKRKRTASHPNSSHADGDGSGPSPIPPKSRKRLKRSDPRKIRLGLRDWSDVLGIASLAGWPNPAVMRTARRCADLFGQDMLFQTLEEGKVELEQDKDGSASWKYVEDSKENDAAMVDDDTPVPKYIDRPKEHAVFCPVEECKRHKQGFSRTWNLNQHLKTKHPTLVAVEERGKTD